METLYRAWRWLADDPHQRTGVRVLQICIGAMLLFQVFTQFLFAAYLWGPNGIGYGSTSPILGPMLGNVFDRVFTTNAGTFFVLFIMGVGALGLLFGYYTRVATGLALVTLFLLNQRLPEFYDGGDNITQLVLIYMLFLVPHRATFSPGQLRVWLHNIAVLAIAVQLFACFLTICAKA